MKIVFPKKGQLSGSIIPTRLGQASPYRMIAAAKSGFDLYVAFRNEAGDQVWIEKASILSRNSFICFEDLQRIVDNSEFVTAHQFFISQGFLDAKSK